MTPEKHLIRIAEFLDVPINMLTDIDCEKLILCSDINEDGTQILKAEKLKDWINIESERQYTNGIIKTFTNFLQTFGSVNISEPKPNKTIPKEVFIDIGFYSDEMNHHRCKKLISYNEYRLLAQRFTSYLLSEIEDLPDYEKSDELSDDAFVGDELDEIIFNT